MDMPGNVVVVDFGGQYAHLIARRVRELERLSVIVPAADMDHVKEALEDAGAVILSGGPASVWESEHDDIVKLVVDAGKPVLGICYGHQLLGSVLGGKVDRSPSPEFGPTNVEILEAEGILKGLPRKVRVWMSHNDAVIEPPPGARILAVSKGSPVAAMVLDDRIWGVQWHPEVEHSQYGMQVLDNFLTLAGIERSWRPSNIIDEMVEYVRSIVGQGIAVSAVSGGVDSTVASVIAQKAIGERLYPVFIDHGLHPQGEVERVVSLLRQVGLNVRVVDASEEFLEALKDVRDPEAKRKIIGRVYGEVLAREARKIGAGFLIQGTIYPDVIESGARPGADVIKTHHNVGGLPRELGLIVVEPLRLLYKDEVRRIAELLGLPREIIWKKPIPGPGLAVRIEGEVIREKIEIVRKADAIVREEIEDAGLSGDLWQYFAVLTASKATGVKGDKRSYGYVVAIRAVKSSDAMTASVARLPWAILERIAVRITGEIPQVTRVVYDITPKPPATIEWE